MCARGPVVPAAKSENGAAAIVYKSNAACRVIDVIWESTIVGQVVGKVSRNSQHDLNWMLYSCCEVMFRCVCVCVCVCVFRSLVLLYAVASRFRHAAAKHCHFAAPVLCVYPDC